MTVSPHRPHASPGRRDLPAGTAIALAAGLFATSLAAPAATQSDPSRQSEASLAASIEVPVAMVGALSEGAGFVVSAVQASGESVAVTISAVGIGASVVVTLSAYAVAQLGIAVGTVVKATVVAAGWMLSAAGEVLCFIANPQAQRQIHSRRLTP